MIETLSPFRSRTKKVLESKSQYNLATFPNPLIFVRYDSLADIDSFRIPIAVFQDLDEKKHYRFTREEIAAMATEHPLSQDSSPSQTPPLCTDNNSADLENFILLMKSV